MKKEWNQIVLKVSRERVYIVVAFSFQVNGQTNSVELRNRVSARFLIAKSRHNHQKVNNPRACS